MSVCEAQAGPVTRGDEVTSLARAFIYAGASSVVSSLRGVEDRTTVDLMEIFHQRLRAGMSKAEALRDAQLHIRAAHPNPYYWAPFVLNGAQGAPPSSASASIQ